ncbi:MAG: hypothetical protein ACREFR_08185 [Limisphaerales bacterium]
MLARKRPLLDVALAGQIEKMAEQLLAEEIGETEKNRLYWLPLKKELEQLRHSGARGQ